MHDGPRRRTERSLASRSEYQVRDARPHAVHRFTPTSRDSSVEARRRDGRCQIVPCRSPPSRRLWGTSGCHLFRYHSRSGIRDGACCVSRLCAHMEPSVGESSLDAASRRHGKTCVFSGSRASPSETRNGQYVRQSEGRPRAVVRDGRPWRHVCSADVVLAGSPDGLSPP